MSSSPVTPKMLKGALVTFGLGASIPKLVLFQFNPESITRSLAPKRARRTSDDHEAWGFSESLKLAGPPRETIRFTMVLDATDALEEKDPIAMTTGIGPGLAALEMMITPSQVDALLNLAANKAGLLDAVPKDTLNVTLLSLGPARLIPVKIEDLSVTEEAFDPLLNPIRARVDVSLSVLSPDDFKESDPRFIWAMKYTMIVKEALALINTAGAATEVGRAVVQAIGI